MCVTAFWGQINCRAHPHDRLMRRETCVNAEGLGKIAFLTNADDLWPVVARVFLNRFPLGPSTACLPSDGFKSP